VPDLLLDALPVIDLLEITGSTSAVAQLTQRDQSSVSRIYRRASDRLGLAFAKTQGGHYQAHANQELLQDLRRSSQRLRLQEPAALRWLGSCRAPAVVLLPSGAPCPQAPALLRRWDDDQRACTLLEQRLLDLAVLPGRKLVAAESLCDARPAPIPLACGCLLAMPLVRHPNDSSHGQGDVNVIVHRTDLSAEPALMVLVEALQQGYRNATLPAAP
jgi:hypothetical protein